jgi:hypothetical protein
MPETTAVSRLILVFSIVIGSTVSALADEPGPIGWWKLDGSADDSSGRERHGVNHGADLKAPGRNGTSAGFNGKGSLIEIAAQRAPRLGAGDFSIAVWVHTDANPDAGSGEIISQYDPVARRGFCLGIATHSGVTTSQANTRNLYFGIDHGRLDPRWQDHGRPGQANLVFALAVHQGKLFAGTCEPGKDQSGHVYQWGGGEKWIDCGNPAPCNSVSALAVYQGELYAGVSKYRLAGSALPESENANLGGRIFRYTGGQNWIDCGKLPETEAVGGLVVFRGKLYASSLYRPAGFFRYEGESKWTACPIPDGKRVEAMCVFDDQLFASSYDAGHVFRYDGNAWKDCGQVGEIENTQTYSFAVHHGRLFVGTWRSGKVFRYDADDRWEDMGRLGEELEVMGMMVHNGKLFAGSLPLAHVYRFDGPGKWQDIGQVDATPDVKYRRAWTLAQFQGRLFCGTLPSGRVLSIEAGRNATYDSELPAGWRHVAAVRDRGKLKLFVDGKLVGESNEFTATEYDLSNDKPLLIGAGPGDFFHGRLSDLRLYDRPLTVDEVSGLAKQ